MTTGAGSESPSPRVVVTVGTDHHPFNRLMDWINDWLGFHPEQAGSFFVQSGTTSVTPACPSSQFLDVERMNGMLDAAEVVVCHGGPESIAAAWARGLLPIVVPRVPKFGEHVDDHQVLFCLKLAELDRVWLAQTPAEFASSLSEAMHDHSRLRASVPAADADAAVERFGQLVDELVGGSRRRTPLWRRGRRASPRPVDSPLPAAMTMPPGLIPESPTRSGHRGSQARSGLRQRGEE